MLGKNNIFSGLFTVIILSIIVFFSIYFLYPDVSMKYFGVAAKPNQVLTSAVSSYVDKSNYLSQNEKDAVNDYLKSEEGRKAFAAVSEAASRGGDSLEKAIASPEFQSFSEKVGSSISKEKLEKLVNGISTEAEKIYGKVVR